MPRPNYSPRENINPDWAGLLEAALTIEGSTGNTYNRLHRYSMGNRALLMYQGVTPQPIATYKGWEAVGRHVVKGAKAKAIIRPITVKLKDELDEHGDPRTLQRFKLVNAVFPISDTAGEALPDIEPPIWSKARALGTLAIEEVPFAEFDGNIQGHSFERLFAINPLAVYPMKTTMHELGHIVHGHTTPDKMEAYAQHRGVYEFQAEGSAHLAMNELDLLTPDMASVSRGYIQSWMRGQVPTDQVVRSIFTVTDKILQAGYEPVEASDD